MTEDTSANAAAQHVKLEAKATIAGSANLHRVLSARLADAEPMIIDGDHVEEIDTAMLQLLVSLWRHCRERDIVCSWHGASNALRRTASLIGVSELLHFENTRATSGSAHVAA